ncbi:MAG: DUF4410 domain-containing protein [Acidobacteriota bacterium]
MTKTCRGWMVLMAVALLFPALAEARKGKGAPTAPGEYVDWNDEMDQIEIVETFDLDDYQRLVVTELATEDTPLPEPDDNSYRHVVAVLEDVESSLIEGLRKELSRLKVEAGESGGEGALLLRGRVVEMDPGSRAARYWASFGAGATRAKISAEVVDAATGTVFFRFTQERRSGVGVGGGKYDKLMHRSVRAIGKDLGAGLEQF